MIIPTYYPVVGGAQVQVEQLSAALAAGGRPVTVLTRRHSYAHPAGLPAAESRGGVPIRRFDSPGGGRIGAVRFVLSGLWFLARRGRRGIYHAHDTGAAGWLALAARRLLGGRCLVKLRTGRVAYEASLRSPLARWQFRALLAAADRVIVVNREVQDLVTALGVPPERLAWVPNGVDVERFRPAAPNEKARARAQLGLAAGERVALYVGRLEHMKGVDLLLAGWGRLDPALRQAARLVLVGDGPERAALEALARSLGLADSVRFAGEQPGVLDYYHAADLFVLPSRTEGLSNALLEAMACGLPVAVSRVGGALDLVQDGVSGLFFEPEDAALLARRLESLFDASAGWARMGQAARASVTANASLAATIQRVEDLYQQLTEGAPARRPVDEYGA